MEDKAEATENGLEDFKAIAEMLAHKTIYDALYFPKTAYWLYNINNILSNIKNKNTLNTTSNYFNKDIR